MFFVHRQVQLTPRSPGRNGMLPLAPLIQENRAIIDLYNNASQLGPHAQQVVVMAGQADGGVAVAVGAAPAQQERRPAAERLQPGRQAVRRLDQQERLPLHPGRPAPAPRPMVTAPLFTEERGCLFVARAFHQAHPASRLPSMPDVTWRISWPMRNTRRYSPSTA
jgi:hypothetical protein